MVVALCLADLAGDGPASPLERVHPDGGGQQGRADHGSLAGALALVQRREHAVAAVHPGQQVGDRDTDALRVVGAGTGQ